MKTASSFSFGVLFGIGVLALCDFLMVFDRVGQMGFLLWK